jgi:hypothetical protein
LVDTPQKGGQGFAGTGWRQDQGVLAALDGRPTLRLGRRRRAEGRLKPGADGRAEKRQGIWRAKCI